MIDLVLPEGATPIDDISDLKLSWVKTRGQLNDVEAENILQAYSKHFQITKIPHKWFTEEFLKQVHLDILAKESVKRKEYIQAMKKADEGDYSSLIDLTQNHRT